MKERGILMSAPMVRAILSGTKSQTRRAVKGAALDWLQRDRFTPEFVALAENHLCPYGVPGDRLWVRETWAQAGGGTGFWYRATDSEADDGNSPVSHWRPSIFMPRAASRITLEVTANRVERLHDISEADAVAEGCAADWRMTPNTPMGPGEMEGHSAVDDYADLWESINGAGSWDANPWVWCVSFRRLP